MAIFKNRPKGNLCLFFDRPKGNLCLNKHRLPWRFSKIAKVISSEFNINYLFKKYQHVLLIKGNLCLNKHKLPRRFSKIAEVIFF